MAIAKGTSRRAFRFTLLCLVVAALTIVAATVINWAVFSQNNSNDPIGESKVAQLAYADELSESDSIIHGDSLSESMSSSSSRMVDETQGGDDSLYGYLFDPELQDSLRPISTYFGGRFPGFGLPGSPVLGISDSSSPVYGMSDPGSPDFDSSDPDSFDPDSPSSINGNPSLVSIQVSIPVEVSLTGAPWNGYSFSFSVTSISPIFNNGFTLPTSPQISGSNNPGSSLNSRQTHITPLIFSLPGNYQFSVRQASSGFASGVILDSASYTVNVSVTSVDGQLSATTSYRRDGGQTVSTLMFNNVVASMAGSPAVYVEKEIIGRDWMPRDLFNFEVDPADSITTMSSGSSGITPVPTDLPIDFDNASHIGSLGFRVTQPGIYRFYLSEEVPADRRGFIYDNQNYLVAVVAQGSPGSVSCTTYVFNDTAIGQIPDGTASNPLLFENQYTASGQVNIYITKAMAGRVFNESDTYYFELIGNITTPMPSGSITEGDGRVTYSRYISFAEYAGKTQTEPILFATIDVGLGDVNRQDIGVQKYTIREGFSTVPNVTESPTSHLMNLVLFDNGDGTIDSEVNINGSPTANFTNTYMTATSLGSDQLTVTKTLEGRPWRENDSFWFELSADLSNPTYKNELGTTVPGATLPAMPAINITDSSSGEGQTRTDSFDRIVFTHEGEYTFYVTEIPAAIENGISYDPSARRTLRVSVTRRPDGKLIVGSPIVTDERGAPSNLAFTNVYKELPGVVDSLIVTKFISGRDWLPTDRFTFSITPSSTNPDLSAVPAVNEVTITELSQNGQASFGEIFYTVPGTYTYTITEQSPPGGSMDGLTYTEDLSRVVTVSVEPNQNGMLMPEITSITLPDGTPSSLVFINTYNATGSAEIYIMKSMAGQPFSGGDSFSFTLTPVTEGAPLPDGAQGSYTATVDFGDFGGSNRSEPTLFATIPFTMANVGQSYVYELTENTEGADELLRVMPESRTVTIGVGDWGNGSLGFRVSVEDMPYASFINVYTDELALLNGDDNLTVTAILDGRDWMPRDEFTFTMEPANDLAMTSSIVSDPNLMITGSYSEGEGNQRRASFGDLIFFDSGTYEFVVNQVPAEEDNGITYDLDPRYLRVEVTESPEGALTAQLLPESDPLVFTNTYHPLSGTLSGDEIAVLKSLGGQTWQPGNAFSFTLSAGQDNPAEITPATQELRITNDSSAAPTGVTSIYDVLPLPMMEESGDSSQVNGVKTRWASFDDVAFPTPGTYTLYVEERADAGSGFSPDPDPVRVVTVQVVDDGLGPLDAAVESISLPSGDPSNLLFTNTLGGMTPQQPVAGQPGTQQAGMGMQGDGSSSTIPLTGDGKFMLIGLCGALGLASAALMVLARRNMRKVRERIRLSLLESQRQARYRYRR